MRCERARRALPERPLGLLSAAEDAALELHLRECAACAAAARVEARIDSALAALRTDYPYDLDLARGVTARVRATGVRREEVPDRQLAWGAIAATLAALALAGSGFKLLPLLPGAWQALRALAGGGAVAVAELARPLLALLAIPLRLLRMLLAPAGVPGPLLELLAPLPQLTAVLGCALMIGTAAFVIARDLRRLAPGPGAQEYRR